MVTAKPELQRGRAKQTETDVFFYIYVCIKDPGKVRSRTVLDYVNII